jgi:hypothetical protein
MQQESARLKALRCVSTLQATVDATDGCGFNRARRIRKKSPQRNFLAIPDHDSKRQREIYHGSTCVHTRSLPPISTSAVQADLFHNPSAQHI